MREIKIKVLRTAFQVEVSDQGVSSGATPTFRTKRELFDFLDQVLPGKLIIKSLIMGEGGS